MIVEAAIFLIALLGYYFARFRSRSHYWSRLGVKQPKSNPFPLGNNSALSWQVLMKKQNMGDITYQQYQDFKDERFYGTYMLPSCQPVLVIKDPDLLKDVLTKDFNNFVDRTALFDFFGKNGTVKTDLMWKVADAKGEQYKDLRYMLSPIFTSGQLKKMTSLINVVVDEVRDVLVQHTKTEKPVNVNDIFGKFALDSMASCVFGIDPDSFGTHDGDKYGFVEHAESIFKLSLWEGVRLFLDQVPLVNTMLGRAGIPVFKPKQAAFFHEMIVQTLKHRKETKTSRNDVIDLLLKAMTTDMSQDLKENLHADEQFEQDSTVQPTLGNNAKEFDELVLVGAAMIMFIAGYDTTSQTLSFIMYELARNPDVQKRLQLEIDSAWSDNKIQKNLDYATVQSLPYLEMIILETLRLHSIGAFITRACVKDYKLRGTNVTIKAGQEIHVPQIGIHRDPKFYPNPLKFNPENFSKENKAKRSPYTFLGFGQGPHSCLGMRFALLEVKVVLFHILRQFYVVPCPETPPKLSRDPASIMANPRETIFVKFESRY